MATPETDLDTKIITLRIKPELNEKIGETAIQVGLKRSDVLRLAIERGMDVLLEQLGHPVADKPAA